MVAEFMKTSWDDTVLFYSYEPYLNIIWGTLSQKKKNLHIQRLHIVYCLFVRCLTFFLRNFHSYGDANICRWRAANFVLYLAHMVNWAMRDLFGNSTYCNTGPLYIQSHLCPTVGFRTSNLWINSRADALATVPCRWLYRL